MPVGGRINRRENLRSKKNDTKENVSNDRKKTYKSKKEIISSIRNTQDVESKTGNLIENTVQINNENCNFTSIINKGKDLGSNSVAETMTNKTPSKRKAKNLDLVKEVDDKKIGTPIKKPRLIEKEILAVSVKKLAGVVEIKEIGEGDSVMNSDNKSKALNIIETPRRGRRKFTEKVIESDIKEKNDEKNKSNEIRLILSNAPVKDFNATKSQKLIENKVRGENLIQNISSLSDAIDEKSLNVKKLPKIIEETPRRGRRRAAEVIESQNEVIEENKDKNNLEVGEVSLNKNEPQIMKSENLHVKNNINDNDEFNSKEVDQFKDGGRKTRRAANSTLNQIKKTETTSSSQVMDNDKKGDITFPEVASVKSPVKELKKEDVIITKKKPISKDEVSEKKVEISGKCPGLVMLENIRNRKSQLLLNEKSKGIASSRKKIEDSLALKAEISKVSDTVSSDDKLAEKPESRIQLREKAKTNNIVEHKDVDRDQNFTDLDNAMEVDEIEENKPIKTEINTQSVLDKKSGKTGEVKISEKKVPRLKAKPVAKNTVEPTKAKTINIVEHKDVDSDRDQNFTNLDNAMEVDEIEENKPIQTEINTQSVLDKNSRKIDEVKISEKKVPRLKAKPVAKNAMEPAKEQINPGLRMFEALKNRKSENIATLATEQITKKSTDLIGRQQKMKKSQQPDSELTNHEMGLQDEKEEDTGNEKAAEIQELKNPKLVNKKLINNKETILSDQKTTFSSDLTEPALKKTLKPKLVKKISSSISSDKVPGLSTIQELKKRKSDLLLQKSELPLAVISETTVPPQQNNKEIVFSGKKTKISSDFVEPQLKKTVKQKPVEQISSSISSEKVPGLSTIHELKKRKSGLLIQKNELPLSVKSETIAPPQQSLSESISSMFENTKNQRPVAGILSKPSPFKKPSDLRNSSFTPIGFQRYPNTERRQSVTFNREVEVKEILGNSFNSITDDVPIVEKTKDEKMFEEKLNRELERTKNLLSERHGPFSLTKNLNSSFIGSSPSILGSSQNKPLIKNSGLSQLISQRYKNSSSPTQQPASSFQATPMADSKSNTSISESLFTSTNHSGEKSIRQGSLLTNSETGIHPNSLATNSRPNFPQSNWKSFQSHSTTKVLKTVEDLNDSRSSELSDSSVEGGENESKSNCMLM